MKIQFFLDEVATDGVLVSNKISSGGKNYKQFIDYLYSDYKIKPLHMVLPKTSAYVKKL